MVCNPLRLIDNLRSTLLQNYGHLTPFRVDSSEAGGTNRFGVRMSSSLLKQQLKALLKDDEFSIQKEKKRIRSEDRANKRKRRKGSSLAEDTAEAREAKHRKYYQDTQTVEPELKEVVSKVG